MNLLSYLFKFFSVKMHLLYNEEQLQFDDKTRRQTKIVNSAIDSVASLPIIPLHNDTVTCCF